MESNFFELNPSLQIETKKINKNWELISWEDNYFLFDASVFFL